MRVSLNLLYFDGMSSDELSKPLPELPEKIAHKGTEVPVRLVGSEPEQRTQGIVRMQHWNDSERTTRAMIRLAIFWGVAIPSVFIPGVHFCLTPALFVGGPIAAWLAYRQHAAVLGGVGSCPHCQEPVVLDKHPDEWPMQATCDACSAVSSVEKAAPESDEQPST